MSFDPEQMVVTCIQANLQHAKAVKTINIKTKLSK